MSEDWRTEIQKLMDRQRDLEAERNDLVDALHRLYQRCLKELEDPQDVHEMHMASLAISRVKL